MSTREDLLTQALRDALLYVSGDNRRQSADVLREQWERLLPGTAKRLGNLGHLPAEQFDAAADKAFRTPPQPSREALVHAVDILRAHAIAAALARARPDPTQTNEGREAWYDCCRHVAAVVCSTEFSLQRFYELCGVPK